MVQKNLSPWQRAMPFNRLSSTWGRSCSLHDASSTDPNGGKAVKKTKKTNRDTWFFSVCIRKVTISFQRKSLDIWSVTAALARSHAAVWCIRVSLRVKTKSRGSLSVTQRSLSPSTAGMEMEEAGMSLSLPPQLGSGSWAVCAASWDFFLCQLRINLGQSEETASVQRRAWKYVMWILNSFFLSSSNLSFV